MAKAAVDRERGRTVTKCLVVCLLLLGTFFLAELATRIYFAFQVGPNVLLYGTPFFGESTGGKLNVGKWVQVGDANVGIHENRQPGYSKYFPRQVRYDRDVNGELFQVSINSRGFRGKEFEITKKPDVVRIVTLGASSTFGFHNQEQETYPYFLEQRLTQECKSRSFEVINLGIPHLTSGEIASLFFAEALSLQPDVVTFYEGINDSSSPNPELSVRVKAKQQFPLAQRIVGFVRDHILLVAFVDSLYTQRNESFSEQDFHRHLAGKSERFLRNLSRIYEEARRRNVTFIVANQQAWSWAVPKEDLAKRTYQEEVEIIKTKMKQNQRLIRTELHMLVHSVLMTDLKHWALTNVVPFVDIIQALDENRDNLLTFVHLTPKGNRIVAEALANEVLKHTCPRRERRNL